MNYLSFLVYNSVCYNFGQRIVGPSASVVSKTLMFSLSGKVFYLEDQDSQVTWSQPQCGHQFKPRSSILQSTGKSLITFVYMRILCSVFPNIEYNFDGFIIKITSFIKKYLFLVYLTSCQGLWMLEINIGFLP